MIHAGLAAPRLEGEADARILEHPLGVVRRLDARWLGGEQLRVKSDARWKVFDVSVNMEALHGFPLSQQSQDAEASCVCGGTSGGIWSTTCFAASNAAACPAFSV